MARRGGSRHSRGRSKKHTVFSGLSLKKKVDKQLTALPTGKIAHAQHSMDTQTMTLASTRNHHSTSRIPSFLGFMGLLLLVVAILFGWKAQK